MLAIKESSKLATGLGVAIVSRNSELLRQITQDLGSKKKNEIQRLWKSIESDLSQADIEWFHDALQELFPSEIEKSSPLSDEEKGIKTKLEQKLSTFLASFLERGIDLATLRNNKLFREDYPTWGSYCRFALGIHQTYADRLIRAAEIVTSLKPIGLDNILPGNELIARELGKISPQYRQQAWEKVVSSGEQITADSVKRVKLELEYEVVEESFEPKLQPGQLVEINSKETSLRLGRILSVKNNGRYKIQSGTETLVLTDKEVQASEFSQFMFNRIEKLAASEISHVSMIGQTFFYCQEIEGWQLKLLSFLEEVCH